MQKIEKYPVTPNGNAKTYKRYNAQNMSTHCGVAAKNAYNMEFVRHNVHTPS